MSVLATYGGLRPIVIAGNYKNFLAGLTLLSKSCIDKGVHPEGFKVEEIEKIVLDPGGLLFYKEPWIDVVVPSGAIFTLQDIRSDQVLHNILMAEGYSTIVPGWRRFANHYNAVALPESDYEYLLEKVKEIVNGDGAEARDSTQGSSRDSRS